MVKNSFVKAISIMILLIILLPSAANAVKTNTLVTKIESYLNEKTQLSTRSDIEQTSVTDQQENDQQETTNMKENETTEDNEEINPLEASNEDNQEEEEPTIPSTSNTDTSDTSAPTSESEELSSPSINTNEAIVSQEELLQPVGTSSGSGDLVSESSGYIPLSGNNTEESAVYSIWENRRDEIFWTDISKQANNDQEMNKSYEKLRELFSGCSINKPKDFFNKMNALIESATWNPDCSGKSLSKIVNTVYQDKSSKTSLWCHQQAILFAAAVKAMSSHYEEDVGTYVLNDGVEDFKFEVWRVFDLTPPIYPWRSHHFLVIDQWNGEDSIEYCDNEGHCNKVQKIKADTWKGNFTEWRKNREPRLQGIGPERNSLMFIKQINISASSTNSSSIASETAAVATSCYTETSATTTQQNQTQQTQTSSENNEQTTTNTNSNEQETTDTSTSEIITCTSSDVNPLFL